MQYLVNDAGDIYAVKSAAGVEDPIEPEVWLWVTRDNAVAAELRRSVEQLRGLPGFSLSIATGPAFVPGPRKRSAPWMAWPEGTAPPAAIESKGGVGGTLAYFNRLSDALGRVALRLPVHPERSPFLVHDFIQGRVISVTYTPPPVGPGGEGVVYVVDDGYAIKIGHTYGPPAARIAGLQTGNPRVIHAIATIAAASPAVEGHLHAALAGLALRGEWFKRTELLDRVRAAGGWDAFLRAVLPTGEWGITQHNDESSTAT